ncbi:MAG: hypothetical protein ACKVQR_22180 [Aquabacterium sp.]
MSVLPRPALVSQQAVQPLPRVALWLLCAAYVLPGVFGRDPWRSADLVAFAQMQAMATGQSPWLDPTLGGLPTGAAWLPHWIGAWSIMAMQGWLGPALAARVPSALLLVLTLLGVWYACFHWARADDAQPLPFAFGGEAEPVDYARAIADGAVLALMATLGLLQLGHETTPELAQLACTALLLWGLAMAPRQPVRGAGFSLAALVLLAACGAPMVALLIALAAGSTLLLQRKEHYLAGALLVAAGAVVAAGWLNHAWSWRIDLADMRWPQAMRLARLLLWFAWPASLLALWTLWRWRSHLGQRHVLLPALTVAIALVACITMGGSDRALLLALPGLAVLAAFALPMMGRSTSAAIDWFSVFFFTTCALAIWVVHVAVLTGVPAAPARNVAKLAPGFAAEASVVLLAVGVSATLAWVWLVRWRTRMHRPQMWKSLILPAGGVALSWLLINTLWLPMLDYARSQRPLVNRLAPHLASAPCVAAPNQPWVLVAALQVHGPWKVDARPDTRSGACPFMVRIVKAGSATDAPSGWREVARERRPTDRTDVVAVYARASAP